MDKSTTSGGPTLVATSLASTDAAAPESSPLRLSSTGQSSAHDVCNQDLVFWQAVSSSIPAPQPDSSRVADEEAPSLSKVSIAAAAREIICAVGEDPAREGLAETPNRYAEALQFFTQGYSKNIHEVSNDAIFSIDSRELVIVRDIDIFSMCEHHMMHIGYVPNGRVLGLSKLPRIAEVYARRLQIQERLTKQVGEAINEVLSPLGVAVVLECTHMCMVMRGVQKTGTVTLTQSMTGLLKDDLNEQNKFYTLLSHGQRG
ncbi:GTP cyclohydrolase I [Pyricularia oryzae Y34]|uniref:GTP cyclohydrolase 1 n=2 Tax=Pyricularia oryzae TaxID=318829 RepID=A0AA97P6Y9_PYRO3|nr:GTP cyclohydrolase I [Pyricularia oryzae Y34]